MNEPDGTASLMSPAKLAQMKPKAAATPAAWLNQMAADAGHLHVRRVGELGEVLREQAGSPELAALVTQLERTGASLPGLDFTLLEPRGWWARTSGKSRSSGAEFAAQFARMEEATRPIDSLALALRQESQADAALAERALVELEVEYRAIEKIIDQGSRWLQDMRNQLKLRQSAAVDNQAQLEVLEDSRRCDILVSRLKLLRGLCNAAARAQELARATAASRRELAQKLQQALAADVRQWQVRLSAVATAASGGKAPAAGLAGAIEIHEELQLELRKAAAACEQLLAQEQALAGSLQALSQPGAPAV